MFGVAATVQSPHLIFRQRRFRNLFFLVFIALYAAMIMPAFAQGAGGTPAAESTQLPDAPKPPTAHSTAEAEPQQTKRIFFIIPNFRSVSADVKLPPTTTREKFGIFVGDSFDYSAFAQVAVLSGFSDFEGTNPSFGSGFPAYGQYYWRNYANIFDGNLMTEFLMPWATHEDPRYYTLEHGSGLRRIGYALSMIVITRNDEGNPTANVSEVLGDGIAASVSNLYYPGTDQGAAETGKRWGILLGVNGVANVLKEFWPDINQAISPNRN